MPRVMRDEDRSTQYQDPGDDPPEENIERVEPEPHLHPSLVLSATSELNRVYPVPKTGGSAVSLAAAEYS